MWHDQQGFNFANDDRNKKDDLDKSVVDNAGDYVDDVEDGEGHQQVVEGGPHLWLPGGDNTELGFYRFSFSEPQNNNGGNIADKAKAPNRWKGDTLKPKRRQRRHRVRWADTA